MNPEEIIYAVTMRDILTALERRIGTAHFQHLTDSDIDLAKEEVKASIDHNLDIRDYVDEGLDAWEISREAL